MTFFRELLDEIKGEFLRVLWLHKKRLSQEHHRLVKLLLIRVESAFASVILVHLAAGCVCVVIEIGVGDFKDFGEQDESQFVLLLAVELPVVVGLQKQRVQVHVQENRKDAIVIDDMVGLI